MEAEQEGEKFTEPLNIFSDNRARTSEENVWQRIFSDISTF